MDVFGPGIGAQISDVKPGALFLGSYKQSALPCLKLANGDNCIALFPRRDTYEGRPGLIHPGAWLDGEFVLVLTEAVLALKDGKEGFEFAYEFSLGDVVLCPQGNFMKVAHNTGAVYVDLTLGQTSSGLPGRGPWPKWRQWSLQWRTPTGLCSLGWDFDGRPKT